MLLFRKSNPIFPSLGPTYIVVGYGISWVNATLTKILMPSQTALLPHLLVSSTHGGSTINSTDGVPFAAIPGQANLFVPQVCLAICINAANILWC